MEAAVIEEATDDVIEELVVEAVVAEAAEEEAKLEIAETEYLEMEAAQGDGELPIATEPAAEAAVEPVVEPEPVAEPKAAEPELEPAADDPFKGPGDWYVVHTYAGYENKVKTNLESRIHTMQMEGKIFNVHIPMEDVMEIKNGKKQVVQKKVFPGYLLVKMVYDNDSWYVVRNTPGVTGFVSAGTGSKPTPLSRREVEKILIVKKEEAKPQMRLGFESRRRGPDHLGAVRRLQRHHQRDQRRTGQAEGAGQHLRPGDPGRTGLRPGVEGLALPGTTSGRSTRIVRTAGG